MKEINYDLNAIKRKLETYDGGIVLDIENKEALGSILEIPIIEDDTELIDLHYLYDFSDRINFISHRSNFPSIFNYLKTGLLNEEEIAEAISQK